MNREQKPLRRPRKSLGQHYLIDRGIIRRIIAGAGFDSSKPVVEVGPGRGALTLPLARKVNRLLAVEKDAHLAQELQEKLSESGISNVEVINADILHWPLEQALSASAAKLQVIGNLPYNISAPFLEKLITNRQIITRAVLMFQLEVARRLTASPGNKAYGSLSVLVQYHARVKSLLQVSRGTFYPPPKVDSMLVELDFERPYPRRAVRERNFKRVVRGSFAYRRKTLLNALRGSFPDDDPQVFKRTLEHCGISSRSRAEDLDIEAFLRLSEQIKLTQTSKSDK
jgi:16S rRNA (adenine1518-N6/adenine1519-N6)-dimethyltransferase